MNKEKESDKIAEQKTNTQNPKSKRGVVIDCNFLAVREKSTTNSASVAILNVNTEVKINHEESTDVFYKIETKEGISGFCMKSFIKI